MYARPRGRAEGRMLEAVVAKGLARPVLEGVLAADWTGRFI